MQPLIGHPTLRDENCFHGFWSWDCSLKCNLVVCPVCTHSYLIHPFSLCTHEAWLCSVIDPQLLRTKEADVEHPYFLYHQSHDVRFPLSAGDILLNVNGMELTGVTRSEAVANLKNTSSPVVLKVLEMCRPEEGLQEYTLPPCLTASPTDSTKSPLPNDDYSPLWVSWLQLPRWAPDVHYFTTCARLCSFCQLLTFKLILQIKYSLLFISWSLENHKKLTCV